MSDDIPATIANKQPARLADGEFVVPADVVSHLGNGSTEAGAKKLHSMMDSVRKARTGNSKQGNPLPSNTGIPRFAPPSRPPGQQRTNFQPSAGKLQEMSGVTSVAFDTSSEVLTHK
jgi:hypothetical protein